MHKIRIPHLLRYTPHSSKSYFPIACEISVPKVHAKPIVIEKPRILQVIVAIPAPASSYSVPTCPIKVKLINIFPIPQMNDTI
jgi:hypothetical protein